MSLIKNKEGNFYPISITEVDWHCDYLWSTHRGCPYDCIYCSSKRLNARFGGDPCDIRRLKSEWKDGKLIRDLDLGGGVFVSPYNDIMTVPKEDIIVVLKQCDYAKWNESEPTTFIFQTKDPAKYFEYREFIPRGSWLGTTIETSCWENYELSNITHAPSSGYRYNEMDSIKRFNGNKHKYFVTIEPIMVSDDKIVTWMDRLHPDLIFIGANTSKVQLPEPTPDELIELIEQLKSITHVHLKRNLKRLLPTSLHSWFKVIERME